MKLHQKIFPLLLAGVLAVSMLGGCGGNNGNIAEEQENSSQQEAADTKTFVYPLNADISSFNEIGSNSIQGRAIFDPLYIVEGDEVRGGAAVFGAGRQSVQAAEPAYMNKEVPLGDAR